MRSILLHIADDDCLEPRIQVGLDLARTFDGHLTCLQPVPCEYGAPGDVDGALLADLIKQWREAGVRLREGCELRLQGEDVAWNWEETEGSAGELLITRGALNDVVVLGAFDPYGSGPPQLAVDVVLKGRCPILLVPKNTRSFDCTASALVAWDGSLEVSRALRAAVPLLAKAQSVVLASVEGERGKTFQLPATDGAEYLSRHGIGCEMTNFPLGARSVAQVLSEAAALRECGCLIMGAYGHRRITETVFGGVTRDLFADPPLPIFASH